MITVPSGVRVLVWSTPVDFRAGMDRLAALVQVTLRLDPFAGDVFVFCTDGIYETFNAADDEFGADRVAEIVQTRRAEPAAAIVQAIVDAVEGFRAEAPQTDDMTVVVVKIGG